MRSLSRWLMPLVVMLCTSTLLAQDDDEELPPLKHKACLVPALLGLGTSGEAALTQTLLWRSEQLPVWLLHQKLSPTVPALSPRLLLGVEDHAPIDSLLRGKFSDYRELEVTLAGLQNVQKTPHEEFLKLAPRLANFANVYHRPEQYRGQVLRIRGRLVLVRAWPTGQPDLPFVYEGWIRDHSYTKNVWGVLFTKLPAQVELRSNHELLTATLATTLPLGPVGGEALFSQAALAHLTTVPTVFTGVSDRKLNLEVECAGYFLKRYRYQASDSKDPGDGREAPLLLVPTVEPIVPFGAAISWTLSTSIFVLIACTVALALLLTGIFRRGDRLVRARLAATAPSFKLPEPLDAPLATPLAEPLDTPYPTKKLILPPIWEQEPPRETYPPTA